MQTRPDTDPDAATADTAAGDAAACRRPARATGPAPLLSADLTMEQLMRRWPGAVAVLTAWRMACPGCPMAPFMTIDEAARAYGVPADRLLDDLHRSVTDGREVRDAV